MNHPQFPPNTIGQADMAMAAFRNRMAAAPPLGFAAAFPNFRDEHIGLNHFGGTILLKQPAVEWRDVPLVELGNPPLDNFFKRMRAADTYALANGYVGGFPTFYHADYGRGIVCGTVLLNSASAQRRRVSVAELGNPIVADIEGMMRAADEYAHEKMYTGGFHTFQRDGGVVLIKPGVAERRDLLLFTDPR
jgi:hypothetical protein